MDKVRVDSGSFKSFDGTSIYYEVRGQGEPIVFVYGIACLMNHWHFQVDYFSKHYKVILFDIRGHHKSSIPEKKENLTIPCAAKDISQLLRELDIQKAHFVGHSFGGPLLLELYDKNPHLFQSLCLLNAFAKNPIKNMFGLDTFVPKLFEFAKKSYALAPDLLEKAWKSIVYNSISSEVTSMLGGFNIHLSPYEDIQVYLKGVTTMDMTVFLSFFESMMNFDGDALARNVRVPTLLIGGEKDSVTPVKFQLDLHEKIKGSELIQLPYATHCSQVDFPDYVNLKLEKFIKQHKID